MLGLWLALSLSAPPNLRLTYEQKCLYCHSEEVTERRRLTELQWRRLIEQMRLRAPLLITRPDVATLARYMARTLRLVPPRPKARPDERRAPEPDELTPLPEPRVPESPAPTVDAGAPSADEPAPAEPTGADQALAEEGFALMQRRCSKCHTLGRVYGKLDTLDRSLAVVERMSLRTGSGISEDERKLLEAYLRSQF